MNQVFNCVSTRLIKSKARPTDILKSQNPTKKKLCIKQKCQLNYSYKLVYTYVLNLEVYYRLKIKIYLKNIIMSIRLCFIFYFVLLIITSKQFSINNAITTKAEQ